MFLFIIDIKTKRYIFFLLKNTSFCQKKVRVIMGYQNHNNSYINILENVKKQPFSFFTPTSFQGK